MSGIIRISAEQRWMKAGWSFRGVLRSALEHIPDSASVLKHLLDERINGFNYLDLDRNCTEQEVCILLDALRQGYRDTELAGSSSFGDPDCFPSHMEGFAQLICMIEEKLDIKGQSGLTQN